MLEDELVHVLSKDSRLRQLTFVENRDNLEYLHKLKSKNCTPITAFLDRVPMLLNDGGLVDSRAFVKLLSLFRFLRKYVKKEY